MNRSKLFLFSLFIGTFLASPSSTLAAEDSESLDSMWMDQPSASDKASVSAVASPPVNTVKAKPKAVAPPPVEQTQTPIQTPADNKSDSVNEKPVALPPESAVAVTSALATATIAAAPMCSWKEFKDSTFLKKSSWPGIGPFKPSDSDSSDLYDEKRNRLKLNVASDQLNRAELFLGKSGVEARPRDFLDIEMTVDFLLESLGAKAKAIAEFNSALEKNKESIMRGGGTSLNLTAGRYLVNVDRSKSSSYNCLIAVNSLDANKTIIKEHSVSDSEPKPSTKTPVIASTIQTTSNKKPPAPDKKPATKTPVASTQAADQQREAFVQAIKNWQAIKKVAVRKRDSSQLSEILSGRALVRQTDAVKWLATNNKYYDMVPKGVSVEKYQEIVSGKKYLVMAIVRESSKFIDEPSGQVLKIIDDKYTVNYTLEKSADHWVITDSQLLSTTPAGKAPPAGTKPNH